MSLHSIVPDFEVISIQVDAIEGDGVKKAVHGNC